MILKGVDTKITKTNKLAATWIAGQHSNSNTKQNYTKCLISCTKTVRVDSPCHPRLLLALTMNLAAGSTTRTTRRYISVRVYTESRMNLRICEINPP